MGNTGPAAKLTDPLYFEPLHRNITIADPMDTMGGTPLCYVYEPW
jgi:tyrosinase